MSKELLDNVSTIENAIKYLKGDRYIQDDSYSMEALYYIEQALTELEELKRDVEEYTRLQQLHIDCKPHNDFRRMDLFRKLLKVGKEE